MFTVKLSRTDVSPTPSPHTHSLLHHQLVMIQEPALTCPWHLELTLHLTFNFALLEHCREERSLTLVGTNYVLDSLSLLGHSIFPKGSGERRKVMKSGSPRSPLGLGTQQTPCLEPHPRVVKPATWRTSPVPQLEGRRCPFCV